MFFEDAVRWARMPAPARLVVAVFVALSVVATCVGLGDPSIVTPADSVDVFLSQQGFPIVCGPMLLTLLCFGSTRYGPEERLRSSVGRELASNLRWLAQCCLAVTLVAMASWGGVEAVAGHRDWSSIQGGVLAQTLAMMAMSSLMELFVIGLVQYLLVNLGLSWSRAMPLMMVFTVMAQWLFNGWRDGLLDVVFYFLAVVEPGVSTIVFGKLVPFASLSVLLVLANRWAAGRRQLLGARHA